MTAAIFINGILKYEFGVDLSNMRWVQGAMNTEGAHGGPTVLPLLKKTSIENNTTEKTLGQLLAEGAIDATLGTSLPNEIRTNPDVVRLFPNYADVDKDLYKRKRIYPIMHLVAIKKECLRAPSVRCHEPLRRFRQIETDCAGKIIQFACGALHDTVFNARDRRHLGSLQWRSMALWHRAEPADFGGAGAVSAGPGLDRQAGQSRRSVRADIRMIP
jgi:hypothetical protein